MLYHIFISKCSDFSTDDSDHESLCFIIFSSKDAHIVLQSKILHFTIFSLISVQKFPSNINRCSHCTLITNMILWIHYDHHGNWIDTTFKIWKMFSSVHNPNHSHFTVMRFFCVILWPDKMYDHGNVQEKWIDLLDSSVSSGVFVHNIVRKNSIWSVFYTGQWVRHQCLWWGTFFVVELLSVSVYFCLCMLVM